MSSTSEEIVVEGSGGVEGVRVMGGASGGRGQG